MIHITTGNKLDLLYDYERSYPVLRGLQQWGSDEIIPLPHPDGLLRALQDMTRRQIEAVNKEADNAVAGGSNE